MSWLAALAAAIVFGSPGGWLLLEWLDLRDTQPTRRETRDEPR